MGDELRLEELAQRTGEPEKRLREWHSLGLIGKTSDGFNEEDAVRVWLVQLCLRRGITLDAIAQAEREEDLLGRYLELLYPRGIGRRHSTAQVGEELGVSEEFLRRLGAASGFADPGQMMRDQDVEALRFIKTLLDVGFPADAIVEGARVYADSLGRVAEMESRLFHFYVHERLRAQGLRGRELVEATRAASDRAQPMIEPALLYYHQLGWERAIAEDLVLHMAEETGLVPPGEVPGEMTRAVAFIDLASFTPMTAAMGDAAAARILERFSELVRESVSAWEGRVVKQIGDAFMLVFPDARAAVACALEIESRAAKEPQFPAVRAGIHCGTVLYREGDYVGSNVNIASRLAAEAQRHQVLVTAEVRNDAHDLPGIEFARLGKRQLKGLSGKLDLFEVKIPGALPGQRAVDPVCGMELGPNEVAARLSLEGTDRAFCSEECLRKFVTSPEKYGG
jgi:adenylate cyclase